MSPTDTLIFEKKKSEDEWTHIDSFNMKGFDLDDYGHTSSEIIRNFHDKVKDKYKDKCGKIEFEFKQCGPIVNITGDCKPKDYSDKIKKLQHDIIKETSGLLKNEYKDKDITKIENDFFSEYIKNGITIHVRYGIKDCEPIKVAPELPPGPKECTYEALIKFKLKGHCMLEKEKDNLGPLYENLKKKLKTIKNAEYGEHIYEVSIYDPGTSDEHLLKERHIEPDAASKKSVREAEEVIRKARGSSFGKRKSIMNKKNPKNKVYKKRFSKC